MLDAIRYVVAEAYPNYYRLSIFAEYLSRHAAELPETQSVHIVFWKTQEWHGFWKTQAWHGSLLISIRVSGSEKEMLAQLREQLMPRWVRKSQSRGCGQMFPSLRKGK